MRILGIDPGLDFTGYGVVDSKGEKITVVEAGIITASKKESLSKRLKKIHSNVTSLITETRPDVCAIEELYSSYKHPKTAILMGHARGVVLVACGQHNIDIVNYQAKTVKRSITGNGNASKKQVQHVVNRILHLSEDKRPVDVTDALAICITHTRYSSKPEVLRV